MSDQLPNEIHLTSIVNALIQIEADILDDLEDVRKRTANRLQSLTTEPKEGERGGWFGKGLDSDLPEVEQVRNILEQIQKLESEAVRNLERTMATHPLGDWVKRTPGVGLKQCARLLAEIGDPSERPNHRMLWSYCGYGVVLSDQNGFDNQSTPVGKQGATLTTVVTNSYTPPVGVAPKLRRGQKAGFNVTARMRAWNVAQSCLKTVNSPYREVYYAAREKYADSVHNVPCERCGPSGKPAPVGSPLNPGHQHARAIRKMAKAVLKDLWSEARRINLSPNAKHRSTSEPSTT